MLQNRILFYFLWLTIPMLFMVTAASFAINHLMGTQYTLSYINQFTGTLKNIAEHAGADILQYVDKSNPHVSITLISPDNQVLFSSTTASGADVVVNHQHEIDLVDEALKSYSYSHSYSHGYPKVVSNHIKHKIYTLSDGSTLRFDILPDPLVLYADRMIFYIIVVMIFLTMVCSYAAGEMVRRVMLPFKSLDLSNPGHEAPYEELTPFFATIDAQRHKIEDQIKKLRGRNAELRTVIKSMSDGLVLLNADGNIITINNKAREILNVSHRNCLHRHYTLIDRFGHIGELMKFSEERPQHTLQFSDNDRDFEVRFNRIGINNRKAQGYAFIWLDITDKKRSEELRQEFTANVSHELKTPLQSIIGYSELMESGLVKPEDITQFAGRINRQSRRLKALIEDIMLISSLDEGKLSILEDVDIKALCLDVFDDLKEKSQESDVSLSLKGDGFIIRGVNRYLYELIYNLTENAIRYNRRHGRVTISLKEDAGEYTITVSDTGIGIRQADCYRIFERFYRVDKSHSRNTGGTGLGLAIVKRVTLYHKGTIRLESFLGIGSTFTVTLTQEGLEALRAENEERRQKFLLATAGAATDNGATIR